MNLYSQTDTNSKEKTLQKLEAISFRVGFKLLGVIEEFIAQPWRTFNDWQARHFETKSSNDRGDVPGWVLVVLMTAGLVTGIWTIAAPRLNLILKNSLDSMNAIR
jgi:hypothetical protein